MHIPIAIVLVALLALSVVHAESSQQPTQQTSKIFLDPFYRASMSINTNYTYNVTVNPPDGVGKVVTAIISFDAWMVPTITFTAWVNGWACNNPTYVVSTTFASAGRAVATFDCSNIIKSAGVYNVTVRPTQAGTGAVSGWLDLTYMNNPKGSMLVHGTEYRAGELATIWLQLKDEQGLPVNNGACYLDVYAPSTANVTRPEIVQLAPMLHRVGSEGVYYYEMTTPNTTGVYMNIASCAYATQESFVYSLGGEELYYPLKSNTTGTWSGSDFFITDYEDWIYTQCDSSSGGTKVCEGTYDFNTTIHLGNLSGNATNVTNIDLYFMGEGSAKVTVQFSVFRWNDNTWTVLPNNVTFTGSATAQPLGIADFVSNTIPLTNVINNQTGIIRVKVRAEAGSVFTYYTNWLNIGIKKATGIIQDLKGSSEMHVNSWFSALENSSSDAGALLRQINATTNKTQIDMGAALGNLTGIAAQTTAINATVVQINATVTANQQNLSIIKAQTTQINATVNNTASLVSQIWTWVQSIFNWTQSSAAANQKVLFVESQYYQQQAGSILVQVQRDGASVAGAACTMNVYYPNMTVFIVNGAMTFSGMDGMYNYTWTPAEYGSHIGQVNCSGGTLTGQVQSSGSLGVSAPSTGILMQAIG